MQELLPHDGPQETSGQVPAHGPIELRARRLQKLLLKQLPPREAGIHEVTKASQAKTAGSAFRHLANGDASKRLH